MKMHILRIGRPNSRGPLFRAFVFSVLFFSATLFVSFVAKADLKTKMMLQTIRMPSGFSIEVYADNVAGARSLAVSPSGIVYVGTRQSGRVYAVIDDDHDFHADRVVTLAQGLVMPNGVAYDDGDLYIAEIKRISRLVDIEEHLDNPGRPEVIFDQLPNDLDHGWKFIAFGPDGMLYVPIGAPCNVCESQNPVYATIARLQRDGSGFEIYARGVRNSVGFDWDPRTGQLWFTDNGRDWMGDDLPPDELNVAPRQGLHFGFPYCHGRAIPDPQLGTDKNCTEFTPPALELGAHVAALGMRFYTGTMFPAEYRGQIFLAEHGSWNRTNKSGYRVSLVRLADDHPVSYEPFAAGWLMGDTAWGRPVDVAQMTDGSLIVSDDQNGVLYRIAYQAEESPAK